MGVVWKGSGVSGNRDNYAAQMPTEDGEYTQSKQAGSMPSSVHMVGGPSGMDEDYLPSVDAAFSRQPVQDSSTKSGQPSSVQFTQNTANGPPGGAGVATQFTDMPTGGTPDDGAV